MKIGKDYIFNCVINIRIALYLKAIFGKKKDVKELGLGIPTVFFNFCIMLIYRLFPSFLRRVFLFLLGAGIEVLAMYLLLY